MTITSSFLVKQGIFTGKLESSYGSDPTLSLASDALDVKECTINYPIESLERDLKHEDLSPSQPLSGKQMTDVSIVMELKGSGTAGTAPQLSALLQACGYAEIDNGTTDVRYAPSSSGLKSIYFEIYDVNNTESGNYLKHTIPGCVGDFTIDIVSGQIMLIRFSFKGKYVKPSDVASPGTPTLETSLGIVAKGFTFAVDAITDLCTSMASISSGNEIVERPCISDSTSIGGFKIAGRNPSITIKPEQTLIAEADFIGDIVGNSTNVITAQVGSAGNIVRLSGTAQFNSLSSSDTNGIKAFDIPGRFVRTSGDDEFALKFS